MQQRKQFTFYRSIYEAAKTMKDKRKQADFLMAVCNFALNGEKNENLSGESATAFELILPTLETGRRKARIAMEGNEKRSSADAGEQTAESGSIFG